jgi:hypothetical protein
VLTSPLTYHALLGVWGFRLTVREKMLLQTPVGHETVHQDAMLVVRTIAPQAQEELGAQPAQQVNLGGAVEDKKRQVVDIGPMND